MDVAVKKEQVAIRPPQMNTVAFQIVGTKPLMVSKFSQKAQTKIKETQEAGSTAKSRKNRVARDFKADVEAARHISTDGWDGVNASAFRNAMIDACRAASFVMSKAKLGIFCEEDGYDRDDGTPLVRIEAGDFETSIMPVRNATGVMDLRARPMWREWAMTVKLRHDLEIFTAEDVTNLLWRVGVQVGIGEGRPYGREGNGMGFGLFQITGVEEQ